jgi:hypothetical protein
VKYDLRAVGAIPAYAYANMKHDGVAYTVIEKIYQYISRFVHCLILLVHVDDQIC